MLDFKALAQEQVSLSKIMVGREKMSTQEVVDKDFTIIAFDFAPKFDQDGNRMVDDNGAIEEFGVVVFAEEPKKYYCVGTVFTKVCKIWAAQFDGDAEAASAELEKAGGVKVRFREAKTKGNRNLVAVDII